VLRCHRWTRGATIALGIFRTVVFATEDVGGWVGVFEPRTFRRGGTLTWCDRTLQLRPAGVWRERYALVDGEHELAVLDGRGWGKRRVWITVDDPGAVSPALLLFAVYVVCGLAEDASSAAGAGAATGVAATSG
jgi:hypothetical protein